MSKDVKDELIYAVVLLIAVPAMIFEGLFLLVKIIAGKARGIDLNNVAEALIGAIIILALFPLVAFQAVMAFISEL